MFLLEFTRIMCQTYSTKLKEKAMKRTYVIFAACALLLLWSSPVLAGAKFNDYGALDEYDWDISPTPWQESQPGYQDYLAYADQEAEIPKEMTDPVTLNHQIQSTPSLERAASGQDLTDLQLRDIALDQSYNPESITTSDEYFRQKWMTEEPPLVNSDPLYKAMFGLYIKNNNGLSDNSKSQILDELSSGIDETAYPPVPSSYEDYLWVVDEFNQKDLEDLDKELLAGYILADDVLNDYQRKELLQDLGMSTVGGFGQYQGIVFDSDPLDSNYYSGLANPSSDLGNSAVPHDYATPTFTDEQIWGNPIYNTGQPTSDLENPYDYTTPTFTDEQIWGNPISTGQETPFTDSGQSLTDYYRDLTDPLLDSYSNDTLN